MPRWAPVVLGMLGGALAEPSTCTPALVNATASQFPIFHIIGNNPDGTVHDINDVSGVVLYKGVYHIFHQCCQNHWDHVVSTDLLHWTRVPSPLVPNASDPAQWYDAYGSFDGSVTLLPEEEGGPTILYDVIEGTPPPGSGPGLPGDPRTMGVARAADASDPYLVEWTKDPQNPIDWNNTEGGSNPSGVWRSGDHWSFSAHGKRYTTRDASFHTWTNAGALFDCEANGGQYVFARPRPPDGVANATDPPAWTHAVNSGSGLDFQLGTYHEANETWDHYQGFTGMYNYVVDAGPSNNWAAAQTVGDRVLHVGWATVAPHSALTCARDVRFDHRVDRLVANPIAELADLRNGTLYDERGLSVDARRPLDGTGGGAASAADVVVALALGDAAARFGLTVQADAGASVGVRLDVEVEDAAAAADDDAGLRPGTATITLIATGKSTSLAFSVLPGETAVNVRVLVDRALVEAFVADGRAVLTQAIAWEDSTVHVESSTGATADVIVYSMGCGWNDPPYEERP